MIACHLDESFDPKQEGIFAVGGMLTHGRPLFELERRWKALREKPEIKIDYFKASECQRGSKQFAKFVADPGNIAADERQILDGIWSRFLSVLCGDSLEHAVIFGIGVVQDDFYEVIRDDGARAVLGDSPYWFAYQFAMIEAAFAMKYINTGDHVAFVCDEDEEHSPLAPDVYRELMRKNPNAAKHLGSFTTMSDHTCEALQAADTAIYEVRRALHVSLGKWQRFLKDGNELRWQFRKLAEHKLVWLIKYANKQAFLDIVNDNKPGEPLILDHLLSEEFNEDIAFGNLS